MISDIENNSSEDDISSEAHNKLLASVSKMYKKKRVDAATRKEPTLEISEFHLTHPESRKNTTKVKINDLVKVLKKKSKHDNLTNKLIQSQKQTKTLLKPLEKPQAERISRAIGYRNVKDQLNRWDPIVYQQRVAEHVTFPLRQPEINEPKSINFLSTFSKPTELEIKMAELLKQSDEIEAKNRGEKEKDKINEEEEFPLTLAEIVERRQLMAKVRAQQSYREAKAARQSKIKSKKFHRIQKRERIKTEMKEFEELQKKDPDAALKKLEQLEKTRAEERASLRHKSTGQWAKNLTVRAKYDKEARIALAEQLNKSKQLTQKLQTNKDTSEEEEEEDSETDEKNELNSKETSDPNNPWVKKSEVDEFYSGYKKYWEEKNKINDLSKSNQLPILKKVQNVEKPNCDMGSSNLVNNHINSVLKEDIVLQKKEDGKDTNLNKKSLGKLNKEPTVTSNNKKQIRKQNFKKGTPTTANDKCTYKESSSNGDNKVLEKSSEAQMIIGKSGTWIITPVNVSRKSKGKEIASQLKDSVKDTNKRKKQKISTRNIKDLISEMDNLEEKVIGIKNKSNQQKKEHMSFSNDDSKMEESDSDNVPSLEMKKTKITADIDEELEEVAGSYTKPAKTFDSLKKLVSLDLVTETSKQVEPADDIDPTKFLTVTPKYLKSQVPDLMTAGEQLDDDEEVQEEERHLTITEAFADDDIVHEFSKEKEEEAKKGAIENIDLSLPGWGSWGGPNIPTKVSKRKKRRFVIKMPKVIPRKDDRKSNVIINESMDLSLKEHRVNELPFPFTSVKEFEASIRAPIGTNWVPQTAHRKLTLPPVITKMGAIIEPMSESQLIKK